jgi:hypothetical protein
MVSVRLFIGPTIDAAIAQANAATTAGRVDSEI